MAKIVRNYEKIATYFNSSAGQSALSMNNITKFMDEVVPEADRPMVEQFIREELHYNVLTGLTKIPSGLYRDSELTELIIPANVGLIEANAFTGSAITRISIEEKALKGVLDLSIFENAANLKIVEVPDTIHELNDNQVNKVGGEISLPLHYVIYGSKKWCDNYINNITDIDLDDDTVAALEQGGIKVKK